jgi:AcrR family transcriptional regulator
MSVTAATSRLSRKRARTRRELVAAAEKLVASRGLDALSIDEITSAADVAKGTFYTHFQDKDDLANAMSRQIRADLESAIEVLNRQVTDPAVRMANGLSTMMHFAITQPVRARALMRLLPGAVNPDTPINEGLRGDIDAGIASGAFRVVSMSSAIVSIIGIAMSAGMRLSDTRQPVVDAYGFARDVVTTVLVALGVGPAAAERLSTAAIDDRRMMHTVPPP